MFLKIFTFFDGLYKRSSCDKLINNSSGEETLKTLWKDTPKNLKKNPTLLNTFCLRLINQNLEDISEKEILSYMKKNYSAALIKTYLKINHSDPQKPLKKINQWLKNYGNQPELLTSAAKICKKAKRTNPGIWERKSVRYPALHSYRAKIYL